MRCCNLDHFDVCIIGAGVVGLAIAEATLKQGKSVLILESEATIGTGISSRNSEVIHAGIYYPASSLKAELCVLGKELLYDYCNKFKVNHSKVGKLIVANSESQMGNLETLSAKASANGVNDLRFLGNKALRSLEPSIRGYGALISPSTGIVDSHTLMSSIASSFESNGGTIAFRTRFIEAENKGDNHKISVDCDGDPYEFLATFVVNSAGLTSTKVAAKIEGVAINDIPESFFCKGNYFSLTGNPPFSHLIYPVPDKNFSGLGIHATVDLGGQVKFGPDAEYITSENYDVDDSLKGKFSNAIKQYYPELDESKLVPAYSGIRPKIQADGTPPRDFEFQVSNRIINLFGIESPGLTSCLAIGRLISNKIFTH